jgi:hypothetical protein
MVVMERGADLTAKADGAEAIARAAVRRRRNMVAMLEKEK